MIIIETHPASATTIWTKLSVLEMAQTMQSMAITGEPTTIDNLILRGYSSNDVGLYGIRAAHLARRRAAKVVM